MASSWWLDDLGLDSEEEDCPSLMNLSCYKMKAINCVIIFCWHEESESMDDDVPYGGLVFGVGVARELKSAFPYPGLSRGRGNLIGCNVWNGQESGGRPLHQSDFTLMSLTISPSPLPLRTWSCTFCVLPLFLALSLLLLHSLFFPP